MHTDAKTQRRLHNQSLCLRPVASSYPAPAGHGPPCRLPTCMVTLAPTVWLGLRIPFLFQGVPLMVATVYSGLGMKSRSLHTAGAGRARDCPLFQAFQSGQHALAAKLNMPPGFEMCLWHQYAEASDDRYCAASCCWSTC